MTEYDFHPIADMFPLLEGGRFAAQVEDIRAHGLNEPIALYEGKILDGRNRYRACLEAGVESRYIKKNFASRAEAIAYVISADVHRRHLTAKQKRELIEKLLKLDPAKSNLAIAKEIGSSDKTVRKIRDKLEANSEIPNKPERVETTGRKARGRRPKRGAAAAPEPAPAAAEEQPAPAPRSNGNDVDTAASTEAMRAAHAAPEQAAASDAPSPQQPADEAQAKVPEPSEPQPTGDTPKAMPVNDMSAESVPGEPKAELTVEEAGAELKRLKALKAKIKANAEDGTGIDPEVSAKALVEFNAACTTWLPQMNGTDLQSAVDSFAEVVEVPAENLIPDLKESVMDLKIAKAENTVLRRKLAGKLPPHESRAARWTRLADEAHSSVEELISMQEEFAEAKEGQPENLQDAPFAQKCDVICDIDLQSALSPLEEAANAEVPLGFGRDM
jgi:hypothetical protein